MLMFCNHITICILSILLFSHMINVPLMLPAVFHKNNITNPERYFPTTNTNKHIHDWCIGKIAVLYANAILGAGSLLVINESNSHFCVLAVRSWMSISVKVIFYIHWRFFMEKWVNAQSPLPLSLYYGYGCALQPNKLHLFPCNAYHDYVILRMAVCWRHGWRWLHRNPSERLMRHNTQDM